MFDTVALSLTTPIPPKENVIFGNGGIVRISSFDEKPYKYLINDKPGTKEPRITITRGGDYLWIYKAEVSTGEWLYGSNVHLIGENDLPEFYESLSQFVFYKTNFQFDAFNSRVTRLDVTRDFHLGDAKVNKVIKDLSKINLNKYDRKPVNDSTIEFQNKGKSKNKKYLIYNKHLQMLDYGEDEKLLELSDGILRLEIQHKNNRAVSNLAKSLKLPNHNAFQLLNKSVADNVIDKAISLLCLNQFMTDTNQTLETLAQNYDSSMPLILAGHLAYKNKFGSDYAKLLSINLTNSTISKYEQKCKKVGCSSLE